MRHRYLRLAALLLCAFGFALAPHLAFAQGSVAASLSGTVVDSSGAVVPGADVVVKNNATAATQSAVTGSDGLFTIPALEPGTYTVTVTLQGFKTAVLKRRPAERRPARQHQGDAAARRTRRDRRRVGRDRDRADAEDVGGRDAELSSRSRSLPLPGRAAFDLVTYMPGVTTSDGSSRGAMVNGLPTSTVNITLDGMNIQDNYAKTWDGMFTRVSPRLDAVEEVTICDGGAAAPTWRGQGGVQMKFVTRSGTNRYQGSALLLPAPGLDEHEHVVQHQPQRRTRRQAHGQAGAVAVPAGLPHRRPGLDPEGV